MMGSNQKMDNVGGRSGNGSYGTTGSGQSTSGSGGGSPSDVAMAVTPASENTFLRLNHLDISVDDAGSQGAANNNNGKKKKRAQRATGGDKGGRGLRQFSMKVCEKVESKGRTTYNEVADELVAEFSDPTNADQPPDQQQYDEKNIRRRVYDALNVLMAMDIISKDKKEIQWRGLPRTTINDIEELKSERLGLKSRIDKKAAYLRELEDQHVGLQNLIKRNEELYGSGNTPSGGVALPFILVQTRPHATVEVEISEDMQLVHFDFNSTPFELHDDNYVLKAMKLGDDSNDDVCIEGDAGDAGPSMSAMSQPQVLGPSMSAMSQPQVPLPPVGSSAMSQPQVPLPPVGSSRPPPSPPLPGILKGRVKYEH